MFMMMFVRRIRALGWLGLLLLLPLGTLRAQGTGSRDLPATPVQTHTLAWPAETGVRQISFPVDAGAWVSVMVALDSRPASLLLRLPNGGVFDLYADDPRFVAFRSLPAPGGPDFPKTFIRCFATGVPTGTWILEATFLTAPEQAVRGVLQLLLESPQVALLAAAKMDFLEGETIHLGLIAPRSGTPVKPLTIQATLVKEEDTTFPGQAVTFSDDGGDADPVAGDGQFGALLSSLAPGGYHVFADVQGVGPDGPFARTCHTLFRVQKQKVTILGTWTESAVVGNVK